ncbi:hypothetical protein GCM10028864_65470 [Microlunatus parietis]
MIPALRSRRHPGKAVRRCNPSVIGRPAHAVPRGGKTIARFATAINVLTQEGSYS